MLLWQVKQFNVLGEMITRDTVKEMVRVSPDVRDYIKWIKQYIDMGFERIILHNVNRKQEQFIKDFGEKVLPALK